METDDEKLEDLLREGEEAQKSEQWEKSLGYYSSAFDFLIGGAKDHAQKAEPAAMESILGNGAMSTQYLSKFNEYLKKDLTAATVSNNMALLFSRMGNKSSAASFFEQAIDLTPEGVTYDAPHVGLEMLKNLA
jgi:tetratricopeptide (TPR) repeat protein